MAHLTETHPAGAGGAQGSRAHAHHHHDDPAHGHHDHDHRHNHHHHHDHGGHGHNAGEGGHLHSHPVGHPSGERREELRALTTAFVDGFRAAADKTSFLRIAGIPFDRPGPDGLTMHLVDATIVSNWQIGTASPGFASRELVYLPFPGKMVTERETMRFTYVSLTTREDVDLVTLVGQAAAA